VHFTDSLEHMLNDKRLRFLKRLFHENADPFVPPPIHTKHRKQKNVAYWIANIAAGTKT